MLEGDYRELLRRVAGVTSAAECDLDQLEDVCREMERLGWRRARTPQRAQARHPVARKARALWISLHQLGAIGDPSERALEAFGKRQLGVDRLQWADQSQGFRLIEALKAVAERHGWKQAYPQGLPETGRLRWLKDGLFAALVAKLAAAGQALDACHAGDRADWTMARLDASVRDLAGRLRSARAAA